MAKKAFFFNNKRFFFARYKRNITIFGSLMIMTISGVTVQILCHILENFKKVAVNEISGSQTIKRYSVPTLNRTFPTPVAFLST